MKIDKNIEGQLMELGLTREEVKIYLNLLNSGPNSITELSKRTKIKRTSTHNYVNTLIQKGIVSQTDFGGRRKVIAEIPDKLKILIDQQKYKIKRLESAFEDTISNIYKMIPEVNENTNVDVKYYEDRSLIEGIYDDILKSKEVRAYVNSAEIASTFPENFDKFINSVKSGNEIWDLMVVTNEGKSFEESTLELDNYHVAYFPQNIKLHSMDYLIYDNKITIIQGGESPTAIMIQNKFLYENAKVMFDLMWSLLEKSC